MQKKRYRVCKYWRRKKNRKKRKTIWKSNIHVMERILVIINKVKQKSITTIWYVCQCGYCVTQTFNTHDTHTVSTHTSYVILWNDILMFYIYDIHNPSNIFRQSENVIPPARFHTKHNSIMYILNISQIIIKYYRK